MRVLLSSLCALAAMGLTSACTSTTMFVKASPDNVAIPSAQTSFENQASSALDDTNTQNVETSSSRLQPQPDTQDTPSTSRPTLEASVEAGQCWVQTVIHPLPKRELLSVVVRDAANRFEVTPAKLARTQESIIVREGGTTYRIEPPVYKEVKEKVLVKPEIRRTIAVPPVYEERNETVVVEAERTVLEPCRIPGLDARIEPSARPLCARTIPAKTRTIKRQVLLQAATTREEVIPAEYREITRWVLDRPARAVPIEVSPTTAQVPVLVISEPERVEEKPQPSQIAELMRTLYEGEPRVALRQAVCNDAITPELVKRVQEKLSEADFDPGPHDGKLGPRTTRALVTYQRENGLASGALTFETLQHMGSLVK